MILSQSFSLPNLSQWVVEMITVEMERTMYALLNSLEEGLEEECDN